MMMLSKICMLLESAECNADDNGQRKGGGVFDEGGRVVVVELGGEASAECAAAEGADDRADDPRDQAAYDRSADRTDGRA